MPDCYTSLTQLFELPEHEIDLIEAALVIARLEYPGLDVAAYRGIIAQWARQLAANMAETAGTAERLARLNHFFFFELGFRGDTDRYYEPENSYLNCVVDRRSGIPLTLALIYLRLGNFLGLNLCGLSFPGHFYVRLDSPDGRLVLDIFHGARLMSDRDLMQQLQSNLGTDQPPLARFLEPTGKRDMLARLLRNLKGIYLQRRDTQRALDIMNQLLALNPAAAIEYRDRALLLHSHGCDAAATADFLRYLELRPKAADADRVRELYVDAHRARARAH